MATTFLNRNHTYEVTKVGYARTVPIEAVDEDTFEGKKAGCKGLIFIGANEKILISVEAFLDSDRIGILVEKFDINDKSTSAFGAIIERDDLLQVIKKPGQYY